MHPNRLFSSVLFLVHTFILVSAANSAAGSSSEKTWSVMQRDGVHWLRAPNGSPFYSKGINVIDGGEPNPKSLAGKAYYWDNHFPTIEHWRSSLSSRMRDWGFNTRGGWSDPSSDLEFPLMVSLHLGEHIKLIWDDVFDPVNDARAHEKAIELTAPYKNDPWLVGYFTDNEVGWWNGPLFSWYLKKGWDIQTKQVLWRLLHKTYAGRWEHLLWDWVPQGGEKSFEDLKQAGAGLKLRPGGQGIQVVNRFTFLCARRYYQVVHDALRKAHPGALILGDRYPIYYHENAVRAAREYVDVISLNYNVNTQDGWVTPYYFEGIERLTGKPVLITEFYLAADENRSGNLNRINDKPGPFLKVKTQTERAYGLANALIHFARIPNIVGMHWFQFTDEPTGGRYDGEDYNMGLIDIANRPYQKVAQVFRNLNPHLETIHREGWGETGKTPKPERVLHRAENPIQVDDRSLTDWDHLKTRLTGFETTGETLQFADVHVAWRPEGLYLASHAQNYLDRALLDHKDGFPLSETFQMHILVKDDAENTHHHAIHMVPQKSGAHTGADTSGDGIAPRLVRYAPDQTAKEIPVRGHVQELEKTNPHIAFEAFLPARWLGTETLKAGQTIHINLMLTKFFREGTMALANPDTAVPGIAPDGMKAFVLQ